MYRSHWDRARPAYAAVARGANNVRGSEIRDDENTVEANNSRVLLLERDDRLNTAARKQNAFVNKILLEAQRRQYAKGNIITFLYPEKAMDGLLMSDVARALFVCGFKSSDIVSVKLNDYRTNQAEVMLKDETEFSLSEMDRKLKAEGIDVVLNKFDCVEEVLMIYGLPLTNDLDGMGAALQETIAPFVKNVVRVVPCKYGSSAGEFFAGKYNGNWNVRVVPKANCQVPNFIVMGHDSKVMAKAKYVRKVYDRKEMCSDCFSTDHFRMHALCQGPREWEDYCKEFQDAWELNRLNTTEEEDALINRTEDESRYIVMSKALQKDMETLEQEKLMIETRLKDQQDLLDRISSLEENVATLTAENQRFRLVGNIIRQGSRTNSIENLNESMESTSGSDSDPLKLAEKERLRSSTAENFLSDIDLDTTADKREEGGDVAPPNTEEPAVEHVDENSDLKIFAKTEFIYDGFGEEQPVLGTSINGFSDVMEAELIDGRLLTFAVKTKCNDNEACFKYRGVGSYEAEFECRDRDVDGNLTCEAVGQGFGMEIDLENVDWKVGKFTSESKELNNAFIRKFGHYLK